MSWNMQLRGGGVCKDLKLFMRLSWASLYLSVRCFSEIGEGLVLSVETLIPKQLCPRSCRVPQTRRCSFRVGCRERRVGLAEKARCEGATPAKILNALRSGGRLPKNNRSRTSMLERACLARRVSMRMHFKWKPLITYTVVAGSISFARMHFQWKGKLFCQPLDVISGLNINSRSVLRVGSRFAACCLNPEDVAPLFGCSFIFFLV